MPQWNDYAVPADLPPPVITDPALPLVSIVTPSYNQGAFIGETIASVLDQNYPNIEYWVIDGASSDNTLDVLRTYDDDPRLNWISAPDRGQADAVNQGWRRCRGDIIGWLNSDDTYLPGALRRLVTALVADPQADIVCGDALRVTAGGQPIERMYGGSLDFTRLLRQNYINQPATIQRRRVVERAGPLRLHWRYALDYDFYLRALREFRLVYLPELCATYRMHEVSKTTVGGTAFVEELAAAVNDFLADPAAPHDVRRRRRAIQSDWLLQGAIAAWQARADQAAIRSLLRAVSIQPLRPRLAFVALVACDRYCRTSLHDTALNVWQQLRLWRLRRHLQASR